MSAQDRNWFPHIDPLSGEVMGAVTVPAYSPTTTIEPEPTVKHSRLWKVIAITLLMVGLGALMGAAHIPAPAQVPASSSVPTHSDCSTEYNTWKAAYAQGYVAKTWETFTNCAGANNIPIPHVANPYN